VLSGRPAVRPHRPASVTLGRRERPDGTRRRQYDETNGCPAFVVLGSERSCAAAAPAALGSRRAPVLVIDEILGQIRTIAVAKGADEVSVVGLVGDHNPAVPAHRAIPLALQRAAHDHGNGVRIEWVPTQEVTTSERVASFSGLWCVPGSPYRSMSGALRAIRYARENRVPFLGTCGGFQHAVIEYAQNVLGWSDAAHAEMTPHASRNVVSLLSCGILDGAGRIRFRPSTKLSQAYAAAEASAEYFCRYGVNPEFRDALVAGPLREAASDDAGDIRAVELDEHPFFVATLFQPERAALRGAPVPIATAFLRACAGVAGETRAP
jgi:CTP synthase (UTP-ammonia lyase)